MVMPNFVIIGAAKSGTTALYDYLKQHPQIFMTPTKETNFFAFDRQDVNFSGPGDDIAINKNAINNIADYRREFDGVNGEIAIGEASPLYLYHPGAAERMKDYVPNAKLIAILRNPVDRAYASFLHLVRDNREPLQDFRAAIMKEDLRISNNWEHLWHYTRMGLYSEQLDRYFSLFKREQIKVYLYDDFQREPGGVFKQIFEFLGVDEGFIPDTSHHPNRSGIPKNVLLHKLMTQSSVVHNTARMLLPRSIRQGFMSRFMARNLVKPPLSNEVREHLISIYREDLLRLETMIDRELSHWYSS